MRVVVVEVEDEVGGEGVGKEVNRNRTNFETLKRSLEDLQTRASAFF